MSIGDVYIKNTNLDLRKNLKTLSVGQAVKITGEFGDTVVGKIKEIDLEAEGIWLLLVTEIKGMKDWDFSNSAFYYAIDINKLIILPQAK
ncbi:hypothetical protein A8990_114105 [Paenibacillus taihuensis]|uniref:Uncharacterized protein n=1 Tax=Paenibacillus taihuensis TaxID=1156355 RepID=A0A3D9RX73_9BACL|nr:hypothetical protein [Paenibacillus taihuensis]REE84570.1 hypothetical protein A8990_114105 [Paenibacillus taihuensis]